ncbi:hypothetical protein HGRIS_006937 [Hohenbuehelia grisea]|uniref:O-methyltransferase n=1 Tax=Hohenbuehelia grisea TaxID=104357 RepID=A0ABR3JAY5_9AGAR
MTSISVVRQLLNLLTEAVDSLEETCAAKGIPIPDLNEPFHPASEAFRADPAAADATRIIGAAAHHLAAIVAPPPVSMYSMIGGMVGSSALRVCLESHVTEILRTAGPKGMTPEEISAINGQDPKKLGRFLRMLSTFHIYREIGPNLFTNNRVSSMLDTLKSYDEIVADPSKKNDGTPGFTALVGHHLDEVFKAAAYSWEAASTASKDDFENPAKTPFNKAFNTDDTFFQYFQRPDQAERQRRFGLGMKGVQALQHPDVVLSAFDWQSLPTDSVVVDIGGGIGHAMLPLVKRYPQLKIVVQDLPSVVEDAKPFWTEKMPEAITSGQVTLEGHDFFEPQTRKASVFFLKQVLHDWPDQHCVKILTHLRAAATPDTRLVVMDSIIPYACHDPSASTRESIKGYEPEEAPAPLLSNYGSASAMAYYADIVMYISVNSQERTITHHVDLLRSAGWKIVAVHRPQGDGSFHQGIEAIPIYLS